MGLDVQSNHPANCIWRHPGLLLRSCIRQEGARCGVGGGRPGSPFHIQRAWQDPGPFLLRTGRPRGKSGQSSAAADLSRGTLRAPRKAGQRRLSLVAREQKLGQGRRKRLTCAGKRRKPCRPRGGREQGRGAPGSACPGRRRGSRRRGGGRDRAAWRRRRTPELARPSVRPSGGSSAALRLPGRRCLPACLPGCDRGAPLGRDGLTRSWMAGGRRKAGEVTGGGSGRQPASQAGRQGRCSGAPPPRRLPGSARPSAEPAASPRPASRRPRGADRLLRGVPLNSPARAVGWGRCSRVPAGLPGLPGPGDGQQTSLSLSLLFFFLQQPRYVGQAGRL